MPRQLSVRRDAGYDQAKLQRYSVARDEVVRRALSFTEPFCVADLSERPGDRTLIRLVIGDLEKRGDLIVSAPARNSAGGRPVKHWYWSP